MRNSKLNKKYQYLFMSLFSLILFIGCGASKVATDDQSSIDDISTDGTKDGFVTHCNGFQDSAAGFAGLLTTYAIAGSGDYDYSKVPLRLVDLPRKIFTSNSYKVEMYLWYQSNGGSVQTRQTPAEFYIQNRYNGEFVLGDDDRPKVYAEISLGYINEIIDAYDNPSSYTVNNFLQKHNFLLVDLPIEYNAIVIALYPKSGGSALDYTSFLLPPFYSNPNVFLDNIESVALRDIHPHIQIAAGDFSEEHYYSKSEEFCADHMRERSLLYTNNLTDIDSVRNIASTSSNNTANGFWQNVTEIFASMGGFLYNLFSLEVFPVPVSSNK